MRVGYPYISASYPVEFRKDIDTRGCARARTHPCFYIIYIYNTMILNSWTSSCARFSAGAARRVAPAECISQYYPHTISISVLRTRTCCGGKKSDCLPSYWLIRLGRNLVCTKRNTVIINCGACVRGVCVCVCVVCALCRPRMDEVLRCVSSKKVTS